MTPHATTLPPRLRPSLDLTRRLAPFRSRGLVGAIPSPYQLLLGQIEMAPYVLLPDAGDDDRYRGARLGHPLLRTPLIASQIGWEHFRIGHGLHSTLRTLVLHLAYVHHEGMPVFDLQLVQTHDAGLDALGHALTMLEDGHDREARHHRRLIDLVIPDASGYRARFLGRDGWIARAARFDYPRPDDAAGFLRPEFTQLTSFLDYCRDAFPERASVESPLAIGQRLAQLSTRRLREHGQR